MKEGFTTLELILVVGIIGLLIFLILGYYVPAITRVKNVVLKAELKSMRAAIGLYKIKYNGFPPSLTSLEEKGYLELERGNDDLRKDKGGNLLDPFGRRYQYNSFTGKVWRKKKGTRR